MSPAFDVIWSYNPTGKWTDRHQMSINGKRGGFARADLLTIAEQHDLKDAEDLIERVMAAVADWPRFAKEAGVPDDQREVVAQSHRLALAGKHQA